MRFRVLAYGITVALLSGCTVFRPSPLSLVDPFIGTAVDHGQLSPAATIPFGMVKLGPDTYPGAANGRAHAGYDYNDTLILGFSHLRVDGMGCRGEGGNVLVSPQRSLKPLLAARYALRIVKRNESAEPGYYRTDLANGVTAELTATAHAGLHRYRFRGKGERWLLLDLGRSFTEVVTSEARIAPTGDEVLGTVVARHNCGRADVYTVHFAARFKPSPVRFLAWRDSTFSEPDSLLRGSQIGLAVQFPGDANAVLVKVGLSAISPEQAARDREREVPDWNFGRARAQARRAWDALLRRVHVRGDREAKVLFYTALYRVCTGPFHTTSTDGTYRGTDGRVHRTTDHVHYDGFSLWDTFRTKYPLLSLVAPDVLRDIVCSLVDIYREGAQEWPWLDVRHEHAAAVILDAYRKGIRSFDAEAAYEGMRRDALDRMGPELEKLGYIPARPDLTLEAAYESWCVAKFAELLGRSDEAARFYRRASFYRNVWDDSLRFFRARATDGSWLPFPSDPTAIDETYVYEGSMWQWRWFVPHDVPGLIQLFGGPEAFVAELRYFFEHDLYNHGNQPDLHVPYLFACAGFPWRTQEIVRRILTEPMTHRYGTHGFYAQPVKRRTYQPTPDGFIPEMDDDCGTMWAWYALSAMGLYQVCPGEPVYQITTPIFRKTTLRLDGWGKPGKSFSIITKGDPARNRYIVKAVVNGTRLPSLEIPHNLVVEGGKLELVLASEPPLPD